MDNYNTLVLMEKDRESGLFTQTIDSYEINEGMELIESAYLSEENEGYFIYLTLTTEDVEDYLYYGIYDLYDEEIYGPFNVKVLDGSGEYNPRWIIRLKYSEVRSETEQLVNSLVEAHRNELLRVLPLVELNREKYESLGNEE